jgi:hypothetical protein
MPDDGMDNNLLLLEIEEITEQLKKLVIAVNSINSNLRIISDRLLRVGK